MGWWKHPAGCQPGGVACAGNGERREEVTIAATDNRTAEDSTHTFLGWTKHGTAGTEFAEVRIAPSSLRASGVALGTEPVPYRVDYELATGAEFVTTELTLAVTGNGWWRRLGLTRSPEGEWSVRTEHDGDDGLPPPGGDTAAFAGARDPDVELSPLFNTMPVLRHRLHEPGERASVEFVMAWVSLPDLRVHGSRQRYSHLGTVPEGRLVRYESLDNGFSAEVVFDDLGLVLDYPEIGRRIITDAERRQEQ